MQNQAEVLQEKKNKPVIYKKEKAEEQQRKKISPYKLFNFSNLWL